MRACGLGTAEVDADPAGAVQAIVDEAAKAVAEDGADVICLGCAGMAGVTAAITAKLGVPAVDGVAAAVALAQALVGLGLCTSKAGVYAPGPDNPRSHWPLSHITGTRPVTEVDLASRALGGSVVAASDESFGFKERLIDPAEPAFVPGTYDLRGEVVDGWETRRHADGDWAIVRLGVGGRLRTIDVDTRFFAGNHPTGCRVDACVLDPVADPTAAAVEWTTIVATAALKPDSHNAFAVADPRRYTHVRLQLHSDGGVARLRAYGEVIPDPALWAGVTVEVSSVEQGGRVEWSADSFYSDACALIAPDRPRTMGDGWETRRRRDIGPDTHDAVMISFAVPADLQRIEIDTSRFVFNASPEVSVLGSRARPCGEHGWALVPFDVEVLARTRIAPDARQVFVVDAAAITALRVQAYPDGGIARVRAFGTPTAERRALRSTRQIRSGRSHRDMSAR